MEGRGFCFLQRVFVFLRYVFATELQYSDAIDGYNRTNDRMELEREEALSSSSLSWARDSKSLERQEEVDTNAFHFAVHFEGVC